MMLDKVITPREPTFELDDFNRPLEVEGADAWIRDVVAMAFYEPGTFAADPNLGVAVNTTSFEFMDDAVISIREKLTQACRVYLSDVPIESLVVSSYYWDELDTNVLAINVSFRYEQQLKSYAAYATVIDHQLRYIVNQLTP